mmetsp:Transcript_26065/g.66178  ORF Transcript_26065/g.66178 Transcript_26065/m.66178 type:complete len:91 (+) Transcript_26065:274-546(+)
MLAFQANKRREVSFSCQGVARTRLDHSSRGSEQVAVVFDPFGCSFDTSKVEVIYSVPVVFSVNSTSSISKLEAVQVQECFRHDKVTSAMV